MEPARADAAAGRSGHRNEGVRREIDAHVLVFANQSGDDLRPVLAAVADHVKRVLRTAPPLFDEAIELFARSRVPSQPSLDFVKVSLSSFALIARKGFGRRRTSSTAAPCGTLNVFATATTFVGMRVCVSCVCEECLTAGAFNQKYPCPSLAKTKALAFEILRTTKSPRVFAQTTSRTLATHATWRGARRRSRATCASTCRTSSCPTCTART